MDIKIKELEAKVDRLAAYNKTIVEKISEILNTFKVEFDSIHKELKIINTKIDNLDGDTSLNFNNVDSKLNDLGEKISQISIVTGYEDQIENNNFLK
ncbi:MAG: hypothetical protein ACK5UE_14950 [Chitinophagales bacterium]|jgi:archaellum component FlaC|nr:hypothetical protein [Sphingobacteriales bacterium]